MIILKQNYATQCLKLLCTDATGDDVILYKDKEREKTDMQMWYCHFAPKATYLKIIIAL